PPGVVRVAAKVRDEAGNETTATTVLATHGRSTGGTSAPGCGSTGCGAGGAGGGFLGALAALAAALPLAPRRLGRALPIAPVPAVALALGACSDGTAGRTPVKRCTADTDCQSGEKCDL